MDHRILWLVFLFFSLSACSTAKNQGLTEAIPLRITGEYEGEADIEGDVMNVVLFGVAAQNLSAYKNVKPLTGGNHIPLYFDTDMKEEGAEYGAFIYSDEIALKQDIGVGWHIKELTVLPYRKELGNIYFNIPLKYFGYKPFRAWTQKSD
ncbi:MAG: hypothetical protein JW847_04220 [Candidatus Omnitrophica bacterium]|nr:hypothetical protein [Candidatus Omnitrophota bacterium]